jgi:serine/threonine protein kinase
MTSIIATPGYAAPELSKLNQCMTNKVDVFSFAIILWQLYTGQEGWEDIRHGWQVAEKFANGERFDLPPNGPFNDLIKACWNQDPEKRPTFIQIFQHLTNLGYKSRPPSLTVYNELPTPNALEQRLLSLCAVRIARDDVYL